MHNQETLYSSWPVEAVGMIWAQFADYIMASGQVSRINRPDT